MAEVREQLRESLELPTRYAKLVAKAPLRLRTGLPSPQAAVLPYIWMSRRRAESAALRRHRKVPFLVLKALFTAQVCCCMARQAAARRT